MKNNILHTKGISNYYTQQYIDHDLFKQTLLNNNIPDKIKFNAISVRKQRITTREIEKKNTEFLNDKRYIENKFKYTSYFIYRMMNKYYDSVLFMKYNNIFC